MKKVSMRDIANELNLSITAVSFVVNGKNKEKGISDETTRRIKEHIQKRGFNPNASARALRTGKSNTIVFIAENISNSFFSSIAKLIENEAHKNDYKIFYGSTENNSHIAKALIANMKNSGVDGFIITPTKGLGEEIQKLTNENIPFVLIDRIIPNMDCNYVIIDNYLGAYNLTRHLIGNGYQKIGFVTLANGMSQMEDRKRGFLEALATTPQQNPPVLEVAFQDSNETAVGSIEAFISTHPDLDALFFSTNYLGIAGLEALQKNKIAIPGQIAVVSFDDNIVFRFTNPTITVAAQPIKEIATKSIELLINNINKRKKQLKPVGLILKPEIIIRNSSPRKTTVAS